MKRENTSQRLKEIMSERNLKQVDILSNSLPFQKELGIKMSKNHISQYVNGKSNPDNLRLVLLAKTLDVSETWLMGYDVPKFSHKALSSSDISEYTLIKAYKELSKPRKTIVLETAKDQLQQQKNEKVMEVGEGFAPYEVKKINDFREENGQTLHAEGILSAGSGISQEYNADIEVWVPNDEIPDEYDSVAIVAGDSMFPRLHNGDILFVKEDGQVDFNQVGIFQVNGENFVKKLCLNNIGKPYLESLNKEFDDIFLSEDDDIRTIGAIVGEYRK